jgi:hypothetical protein
MLVNQRCPSLLSLFSNLFVVWFDIANFRKAHQNRFEKHWLLSYLNELGNFKHDIHVPNAIL